jgi:dTDP-4-dehydrorhamnose reductase
LFAEALSREHLDIADAGSIAAALERLRPWAVVNTAGYVRVDDAEQDQERCARSNTLGPRLLAEACAQAGVRLVTFSSDLVFDGCAARPYVESDPVRPLSIYGRTKADGEVAVLSACPDALVVRTSAFFGPWDRWNVIHLAMEALASGRPWRAAADQRVSPTYVPDLVDTCLDLLIDGAAGLWHLVNAGDVSWAELARKAAAASGGAAELVEECTTAALGLPARRPAYSVLGTDRGQILPPLDSALARFFEERLKTERRGGAAA